MQSKQSVQLPRQSSIYPYYKADNIFQREQSYYEQLQRNTRRPPQVIGYQSSGQWPQYQQVQTHYQNPPNYPRQNSGTQLIGTQSNARNAPIPNQSQSQSQPQFDLGVMNQSFGQTHENPSPFFSKTQNSPQNGNLPPGNPQILAFNLAQMSNPVNQANIRTQTEENRKLKQKLDDLINFKSDWEDGSSVQKKYHYNKDSNEGRQITSQEEQIQRLLDEVKKNNGNIWRCKNAIVELQKSMNNIQSVDREIYKQLKSLSNRDQQLLDRATAALARGSTREEIATILERIIS